MWKVKNALKDIGPSIFHGGFSTLLVACVLAPSQSYIFLIFFRCFFGITIFGLGNGFILLPVLLVNFGPVEGDDVEEEIELPNAAEIPVLSDGSAEAIVNRGCCFRNRKVRDMVILEQDNK